VDAGRLGLIVNKQVRTKGLGLKEFLARKRNAALVGDNSSGIVSDLVGDSVVVSGEKKKKEEIKNDEPNKEQSDQRLHEVSQEENSREASSNPSQARAAHSNVTVLQEDSSGAETKTELVNENGTVAS
jgi:hypothetical protein